MDADEPLLSGNNLGIMVHNYAEEPLLWNNLMVHNDAEVPFLPWLYDTKRRRLHRSRDAPAVVILPEKNDGELPRSESFLAGLHPSFRQVALFLAIYLGVGTLCFYLFNDQIRGKKTNGIVDAMYLCIVTMTSAGYGDLVPDSNVTKLVACAIVFTETALVGLILSKSADYLVEKQVKVMVKALQVHEKVGATEILKETETNKVKNKFLVILTLLLVLTVVGTVFLSAVENMDLVHAFYCVCSTITAVGYGDKSFSTIAGRIFAVFWILTTTICVAQFYLYLAELITERRQQSLVKSVLMRRFTIGDLLAADIDNDGCVSAAEFVLHKLKEMGKISQQDIAPVLKEFENLDFYRLGKLTLSDIIEC